MNNKIISLIVTLFSPGWFRNHCYLRAERADIPNFSSNKPSCIVIIPGMQYQCTAEGCSIPVSKPHEKEYVQISFSCLPQTSPTGFENPSDDVKVQSIQSKHTNGKISFAENIDTPVSKRAVDVNFCHYGKSNNLCGFARLFKVKAHANLLGSDAIKDFLNRIEIRDAVSETESSSQRTQ